MNSAITFAEHTALQNQQLCVADPGVPAPPGRFPPDGPDPLCLATLAQLEQLTFAELYALAVRCDPPEPLPTSAPR